MKDKYTENLIAWLKVNASDLKIRLSDEELTEAVGYAQMGQENGYTPEELAQILADEFSKAKKGY